MWLGHLPLVAREQDFRHLSINHLPAGALWLGNRRVRASFLFSVLPFFLPPAAAADCLLSLHNSKNSRPTMRSAFFSVLPFFLPPAAAADCILSLHNSKNSLTTMQSVHVSSNRAIIESDNILKLNVKTYENLQTSGIKVIMCVRYRSVPDDRDGALANFSTFVSNVAPFIYALVLGNEPDEEYDSAAKKADPVTGVIPAVDWIGELARAANEVRASNQNLSNFLLVNPEPNIRFNTVNGWNCNGDGWPAQLLATGSAEDNGFDRQDIHLHMEDIPTLTKAVTKVTACTSVPFLTTEWSQAPIVETTGWLKEPCALNESVSNGDFLNACYHSPVSQETWTAFVTSAPYNVTFMSDAMKFFEDNDFAAAACEFCAVFIFALRPTR